MATRKSKINILILDDEKIWQSTTQKMCTELLNQNYQDHTDKPEIQFYVKSTVEDAKNILLENPIHLFLLDKDLGVDKTTGAELNGVDYISEFKSLQPLTQILMLTSDITPTEIARAVKNGASDYLFKSDEESHREYRLQVIKKSIGHYFNQLTKVKDSANFKKGIYSNYVAASLSMQRLDNKLLAIAESKRSVLLLGATGLGKGAVARRINELSRIANNQSHREFVQINFAAFDKQLAESILFGTEPGAFTDAAKQTKPGLLDAALDGDIFLDEIGDASLDLQLKILKVVEEKEYYRVGGKKPIKTNARFIFATNKDIQALVAAKEFREDLYMRISVFEENIPTLTERKDDIPHIISGYLAVACAETKNRNITIEDFPEDLMNYFLRDEIPGNIRGIENDVERLVAHIPYDSDGRPIMTQWKKALGHNQASYTRKNQILSVEQLKTIKTNFLDKNFPGFWELSEILERRLFEEIQEKNLSVEQAAKILKVSTNTIMSRRKQFANDISRRNSL